ncbi:hypothetical protein S245_001795, partial [Arachis hypogaea]
MNGGGYLVVLLHVYKTWQFAFLAKHLLLQGRKEKKRKQKLQYDPIDIESIDMVDFWVTEEVEKEPDLPSNIEDLL